MLGIYIYIMTHKYTLTQVIKTKTLRNALINLTNSCGNKSRISLPKILYLYYTIQKCLQKTAAVLIKIWMYWNVYDKLKNSIG